jgi:hypothetical protein
MEDDGEFSGHSHHRFTAALGFHERMPDTGAVQHRVCSRILAAFRANTIVFGEIVSSIFEGVVWWMVNRH